VVRRRPRGVPTVLAAAALASVAAAPSALAAPDSHAPRATVARGLSLVQFAQGAGAPGWAARVLSTGDAATTTVSSPRAAPDADGGVQVAYRNPAGDALWLDGPSTGPFTAVDLTALTGIPPLAGEPTPAVSPHGLDEVFAVTRAGHLVQLTWDPYRRVPQVPGGGVPRLDRWTRADLTRLAGPLVEGTPSVVVVAGVTTVLVRSPLGDLMAFANDGQRGHRWNAYDLSLIAAGPRLASDPAAVYDPATQQVRVAGTELAPHRGDVVVFAPNDVGGRVWSTMDVTAATKTQPVAGGVAAVVYGGSVTLLGASAAGDLIELAGVDTGSTTQWASNDVTQATPGSPPAAGTPSASVSGNRLAVVAVAASWGDLVEWTSSQPSGPFTVVDLTETGAGATRTVAGTPAAVFVAGALSVFAAGVKLPAPRGTGVYAIPSARWGRAITDGWRVLGVTGGLGSRCAPWTALPAPTDQPDEAVGAVIQSSHVRETWLSFWTVSGPGTAPSSQCTAEPGPVTAKTFLAHGYAAGRAVATLIDAYHAQGLGLKPDWVIFDPEGYPDNHSGLWGPTAPAPALARSVAAWYAVLQGWRTGIASVDPSLKAALYANQYEYMTYHLSGQPLPTFIAGAFSETTVHGRSQLVVPSRTAFGPNILGFAMFNSFVPTCAQVTDERLLLGAAPWGGAYNTIQVPPGKYCPPGPNPP